MVFSFTIDYISCFDIHFRDTQIQATDNFLTDSGVHLSSEGIIAELKQKKRCTQPLIGPKYGANVHFFLEIQKSELFINILAIYWFYHPIFLFLVHSQGNNIFIIVKLIKKVN